MPKKKYIYLGLALLAIMVFLAFVVVRWGKRPIEWTRENSLRPAPIPRLSDPRENRSLIRAIDLSLQYLENQNPELPVRLGPDLYPRHKLQETLMEFKTRLIEYGLTDRFFQFIKKNFIWYKSPAQKVVFTGYHEANVRGSLARSDTYRFPLYQKPHDLVTIDLTAFYFFLHCPGLPARLRARLENGQSLIPYYTREEIDREKKISGRNLELVWVDNPVDVFFLHIQGSGKVTLDNGQAMMVNYCESNGHPYRAIGKLLMDRGKLNPKTLSLQGIRRYLEDHPEETEEILFYNPSYIFFEKVDSGPRGNLGVDLTPFRSVATDHRLFPPAALGYVETEIPVFDEKEISLDNNRVKFWKKFSAFVLNQDSGGAIRGAGKIDLFMGSGKEGEWMAGHMKQPGTFYFLIKK